MPGRQIFAIMRAMAENRRQRILAELAGGPLRLSALAQRADFAAPDLQSDVALMEELGLIQVIPDASDPELRVGPLAEVELSDERVHFRLWSPEEEEIKLTRRRSLFSGL